jgi:hypothetical protein
MLSLMPASLVFRIAVVVLFTIAFLLEPLSCIGQRRPIEAKVAMYKNRPTIFINDTPEYPMLYALTDVPGGRWTWEEVPRYNMRSFCQAGIRLVQVDIGLDHIWKPDGTLTLDTLQRQVAGVLNVCPDAAVFLRFHVNAPKWWQQKNKDENCLYADASGKPDIGWGLQRLIEDDEETPIRHSMASQKWRTETTTKLVEALKLLVTLPEASAIAGVQVAGGVYGEWHYWGFIENEPDISVPMQNYFRQWLKTRYKNEKMLREAWRKEGVNFDNAQVPLLNERRSTTAGIFRDPAKEQNVIDYYQAQHELVADNIIHFCRVVKENWPRPIITGAFYGYFYSVFGREAAGGHLEMHRLLTSPHVDYLSGPGTYYPNAVETGDPYRSRSLVTSVTAHGKLWLDEMDQQPPLLPLKNKDFQESLNKSIANTRRNIMATFTKGHGMWFYDFGPAGFNGGPRLNDHGTWGWWDEPTLRADIAAVKKIADRKLHEDYKSDADVLLVHDTRSFYYTGSAKPDNGMNHYVNNWVPVAIFKSGVVHDAIHIDDLGRIDIENYKAIVFVNAFVLSADRRRLIREKVARDGRHLIYIYAPGYCDERVLNPDLVTDVTGIKVAKRAHHGPAAVALSGNLAGDTVSVWNGEVDPLFVVEDTRATTLGPVVGSNDSGAAKKKMKNYTSWFFAIPSATPLTWKTIFKEVGVHFYVPDSTPTDILYSGSGILAIHSKEGGKRHFKLKTGKSFQLTLAPNSTTLIDLATGEPLP